MLSSWKSSSAKQLCGLSYEKWDNFCAERQRDPMAFNESLLIDLLVNIFEDGVDCSAINTA